MINALMCVCGKKFNPVSSSCKIALNMKQVTVIYRNGYLALKEATLSVPQGTIAGLLGVNGSGKSTLFKAIMGFLSPVRGAIQVFGLSPSQALKRHLVSYVPQSEEVDWSFPVLVENVVMMGRFGHMGMMRIPSQQDKIAVDRALERVGMTAFRKRQIGELSGGQRKRIFLARAIAQDGWFILLDEPFTGVDLKTEQQIMELLQGFRDEGRTMLVSTHNLASVPTFCDYTILLKGIVLACGPTQNVFTRQNIELAFEGSLQHFSGIEAVLFSQND
ncbi:MAG: ferric citrate ABC transporter ATP binding subunit [Sodalis sp. Fle]|nr:MAG: ferric citrate ABC transporter ATP binding subunit [Sodalis sp. Fle]